MKKNKDTILLWISIIVLISSSYYFIYSCYTVEHFKTPAVTMPSNIPSKKKTKDKFLRFHVLIKQLTTKMTTAAVAPWRAAANTIACVIPRKKKTKDKILTLEESYRIKDKRLDETQTLNVGDVEWVKKNQDNKKLKKLWDELRILFP